MATCWQALNLICAHQGSQRPPVDAYIYFLELKQPSSLQAMNLGQLCLPLTLVLSRMDPFPRTEILAPVSSCKRFIVFP